MIDFIYYLPFIFLSIFVTVVFIWAIFNLRQTIKHSRRHH